MKINQIANEGLWGDMKSSFNKGRKDYIAKRAGELGINAPAAPTAPATSVPVTPAKAAPVAPKAAPKAPVKKTLNSFIKEIDGMKRFQQVKIYNYLQDKLF